ncbi:unnamed protein product [Aphis gossypii]|uniref:B-cell lymphoma 9 beta-catenin binding domain-containing protein n=2 Tax=Aphis gossypii TaxID=80765 RepID=A0A9P0J9B2_APHGO|nr:unnamed protein product [Aphis gossypii]
MNSRSGGPSDLIDGCGRVQPLMNNVLAPNVVGNKQSNTTSGNMDDQQQSQIFVFSTSLANKSAESVLAGQYPNIIAYHCTQPQTKKFLEANKLHHRGSLGMNGLAHYHGMSDMMTMSGPNKCQPSKMDLMSSFGRPPKAVPSSLDGQNSQASMMPTLDFDDSIGSRNLPQGATLHHSLTGVQVPDENLTPQQRQHREEQQATLRKLKQVLFPENSNNAGGPFQQQPPVTLSSSSVGGPFDNCSGSGVRDDLKPSIEDDLDVDVVVTAARVTKSAGGLTLPPRTPTSSSFDRPKSIFDNEDGKKKDGGCCGPPPSYHQTVARSTSIPIVSVPICSPNSPLSGNDTVVTNSNSSLPSHTCSALNSPAGGQPSPSMSAAVVRSLGSNGSRQESSNPSTSVHRRVSSSQKNMDMIMTDMKSYNIVRPGDKSLKPSTDAAATVAANLQTSQHQPLKNVDPISSLAQMNQQLANNVASGGLWCPLSPKLSLIMLQQQYQQQLRQRLMPRIPPRDGPGVLLYGGTSIQVKPSAPNTIQYLPNNSRDTPLPPQNPQQQQKSDLDILQKFSGGPGNGGNPFRQ